MANLTIKDINSGIMFGNLTNEQLNSVMDAVKYARVQLAKQMGRELKVGDQVKFVGRGGRVETGKLVKIKIKNATVQTATVRWNVPMNMLEAV